MFYLIQLLNGVQYGLLLFLLASGLTLIFGIMGIVFIATILWAPDGIVGIAERVRVRVTKAKGKPPRGEAP